MADRYDDEARRLLTDVVLVRVNYVSADMIAPLAAALRAAERRAAERVKAKAERECRALRDAYEQRADGHDAHSGYGAYWQGKDAGADGCLDAVQRLDIDAVLATEAPEGAEET